jgi:hypothetical protein
MGRIILMGQTFWEMLKRRISYFIEQGFSVKVFLLSFITACYFATGQPFDWVYVTLVALLIAFREGKELLAIWKGNGSAA